MEKARKVIDAVAEVAKASKQKLRAILNLMTGKCYCQTCGLIFLEMPFDEYADKANFFGDPDRWYCNAALHWLQNQEHIVVRTPENKVLSEEWHHEMQTHGLTTDEMIRNFQQYLEGKGKEREI